MASSELHITDIARADKGCWVAASRAQNLKLSDWVIDTLNAAAIDYATPDDGWTDGLSNCSANCLINHGLNSKKQVADLFSAPDFEWQSIINFGRKCNDEVLLWINS